MRRSADCAGRRCAHEFLGHRYWTGGHVIEVYAVEGCGGPSLVSVRKIGEDGRCVPEATYKVRADSLIASYYAGRLEEL